MITSKEEYKQYLQADLEAKKIPKYKWKYYFTFPILRFQRLLRKVEYYENCRTDIIGKLYVKYLRFRFYKLSLQLGFSMGTHVFGPGLDIAHYGSVLVSDRSKVGKNFRIHSDVNIGGKDGEVPVIGDNVYIGPGAKLFGPIRVGNGVTIGANSVVNRDVPDNVMVAGIPAKIIKVQGRNEVPIAKLERSAN